MKKVLRVFTHGGLKAHIDEILGIVLILMYLKGQYDSVEIIRLGRKESPPLDLGPLDFVVDVGGIYNKKNRFDHHQGGKGVKGKSAAHLVCESLMPQLMDVSEFKEYLRRIDIQDTQGRAAAEKAMGGRLNSSLFVEDGLTVMFVDEPYRATQFLLDIVEKKFEFRKNAAQVKPWVEENSHIEYVGDVAVLVIDRDPAAFGIDASLVRAGQSGLIREHDVKVVYGWDEERSEDGGRSLFRTYNGDELLDFRSSGWRSNVYFVHEVKGFLLKFFPQNVGQFRELIMEATMKK